jgi:hypothetical protein
MLHMMMMIHLVSETAVGVVVSYTYIYRARVDDVIVRLQC